MTSMHGNLAAWTRLLLLIACLTGAHTLRPAATASARKTGGSTQAASAPQRQPPPATVDAAAVDAGLEPAAEARRESPAASPACVAGGARATPVRLAQRGVGRSDDASAPRGWAAARRRRTREPRCSVLGGLE